MQPSIDEMLAPVSEPRRDNREKDADLSEEKDKPKPKSVVKQKKTRKKQEHHEFDLSSALKPVPAPLLRISSILQPSSPILTNPARPPANLAPGNPLQSHSNQFITNQTEIYQPFRIERPPPDQHVFNIKK